MSFEQPSMPQGEQLNNKKLKREQKKADSLNLTVDEYREQKKKAQEEIAKNTENKLELKKSFENLSIFLEQIAAKLKSEGLPLNNDCHLDMKSFENIYASYQINSDLRKVEYLDKKFHLIRGPYVLGEQLEMLKTAIFNKFLDEKFITVRTSKYDDYENGIDNLIIDKETGNPICMFDEVGTGWKSEQEFKKFTEKQEKIIRFNQYGGGEIKYGIALDIEGNKKEIKLQSVNNLPVFLLALPIEDLRETLRQFEPSYDIKSDQEKEILEYFIESLGWQAEYLQTQNLPQLVKEGLEKFYDSLKRMKNIHN